MVDHLKTKDETGKEFAEPNKYIRVLLKARAEKKTRPNFEDREAYRAPSPPPAYDGD